MTRAASPIALLALAALLLVSGAALGHAQFVSSTPRPNDILPEPPASVLVVLSETIESGSARIRVTNATGASFAVNATRVNPADARQMETDLAGMGPCVYTVAWSATSAVDGHFNAGSFSFLVQNPDGTLCGALPAAQNATQPPVSAIEVALRFASFATLAATVGAVGLALLALDPTIRDLPGGPRGRAMEALRDLSRWAGGQAAAFSAFAAAWAAFAFLGTPEGPVSSFVMSLAWRSSLGAGVAALMLLLPRLTRNLSRPDRRRQVLIAAAGLCALIVALSSVSSHAAASVAWAPFGAVFDFMHLGAATFWAGSLMALVVVRGHFLPSPHFTRALLTRFSRLAFYAVGAVLIGGVMLAVVQLGDLGALFTSTYGLLVLAKASLFVPMAALGAHNHFFSIPALKGAKEAAEAAAARIARNVRAEAALGLAVLLVAGTLTALSPVAPAAPPSGPFVLQARSGDLRIDFTVIPDPGPVGVYNLEFQLFNASTTFPDNSTTNGTMTVRLVNSTLPQQDVTLEGPHGNHYFAFGGQTFGQAGTWRLDLDFVRPGKPDVVATFNIVITSG